jgi:hypothetical protein
MTPKTRPATDCLEITTKPSGSADRPHGTTPWIFRAVSTEAAEVMVNDLGVGPTLAMEALFFPDSLGK